MAVYDPNRKHTARGEQRQKDLLKAAAAVFGRVGYHDATTNAIAAEAGVSPATLYQFFPNKDAIASALTESYAKEMCDAERAIDPDGSLSFSEAITALLQLCMRFNRKRPEFHTLVQDAPLSTEARNQKKALGQTFIHFVADRLRRELPGMSKADAMHHGRVAMMIYRGMLDGIAAEMAAARTRLERSMQDAVLRYLQPLLPPAKQKRR